MKVKKTLKTFLHHSYFYLIRRVTNLVLRKQNIWLIGEFLGRSSQDTGYHFFLYCRAQHPEMRIYFVTNRKNITPNLLKIGNVIEFGTIQHHLILFSAKVHIYNNSYSDIYTRWESLRKTNQVEVVCFLQHGVIGLTKMCGYYDYNTMKNRAEEVDIFVTSSEYEKNIVVKFLGHKEENVFITGLSRYDNLFKSARSERKIITYIPTWRDWLRNVTENEFIESEYYRVTSDAIKSISTLQKEYSFEFRVCFHHAVSRFTELYQENRGVDLVDMSTINVQDMILDSALLITDYSSISHDFAYCNKPVIFYQFDCKKFLQIRRGSFIDYKTELFGPVVDDKNKLLEAIKTYLHNDYTMLDQDREKAKRYHFYHDNNNSKRIYLAIEQKLEHTN